MSATRPLRVVPLLTPPPPQAEVPLTPEYVDNGPQGAWLEVLADVQEALTTEPSYRAHVAAAFAIVGLFGCLLGSVLTIVLLRTVGAL